MPSTIENNKRIAKNTLFLYIRMFLMMAVTLYTSRVILKTLGVEDFGIYNVVAGVVVLFSFINSALSVASQRFLSFSLGKQDKANTNRIFSMSLTCHIGIAIVLLVLAESIGLWLLHKMNFPVQRMNAVEWAYQFAVVTCCFQIIRVPYNASIIAYEKMSFYAWISIIETLLKLGIVFLLQISEFDKLIMYSFLLTLVTLSINLIYKFYCNWRFDTSKYNFFWDKKIYLEFISFSGWSLLGSAANTFVQQGLNMLVNLFCGVIVNAAIGISNQVMGAVGLFMGNFQTAFNPQLVKSYASGEKDYFVSLIFRASKYSYFLMLILSLPILVNCNFFLDIWLGDVPTYAVTFSQLMIIFLLVDAISGPLWISVQATGKIRNYQILMSLLIFLNIPLSYLLLYLGFSPIYIYITRVFLNFLNLLFRITYVNSIMEFPIRKYFIEVLGRIFLVTLLSIPLPLYMYCVLSENWVSVCVISLVCIIASFLSIYAYGLSKQERLFIRKALRNKFIRNE